MTRITAKAAREKFSELVSRTAYTGERVIVTRNAKEMVAMISMDELSLLESLLEELQYRRDVEEARMALKEVEVEGAVSWEKVQADLGLKD